MELEDSTEAVLRLQRSLQKFIDTVDELDNEDDPTGDGFTREFRVLRELGLKMREDNTHPAEDGRKPNNLKKNRYKDILPFDETRVKLEEIDGDPDSDYINANFIRGFDGYPTYIATQGPLPATVNDFWRMIWQYKVKVVTMACRQVELGRKKCEQYWPTEVNDMQEFGTVSVTLVSEDDFAEHCTKRVLAVQREGDGERRTVTQFQYTGWPDHDIPNDIDDILEMIALIRQIKAQDKVPIIIHCSAGCGRTGTICAIDYAWDTLKSGRLTEEFNLYKIVKEMREQRQSMIQAPEQYKCAHVAIKIFFEKHQQLMEDHTYGNLEFTNQDENDSGYADPKALNSATKRKVSAMDNDIENTLKYLTTEKTDAYENVDSTPVLIPQSVAPVAQAPPASLAPPPPSKAEHEAKAKPPLLVKPDMKKTPSISSPPANKTPSPTGKHSVFAIEKLENVPASKGNPPQKVVQPSKAEKHDIVVNKQEAQRSLSNKDVEAKRPSVKKAKAVFEPNNNIPTKSHDPAKDRPVLHRVESQQTENKFRTVISIGGSAAQKAPAGKTVSNPTHSSTPAGHTTSQKSKTLPASKGLPAFYEAPQSSVPPSTVSPASESVYSLAADPGGDAYSTLASYSSGGGSGPATLMQTGLDVVSPDLVEPVEYNGVEPAQDGMYATVTRTQQQPQTASDSVYESVAVDHSKNTQMNPPPIPDRNYVEDEKTTAHEKPGSSEHLNGMGKKGKLDQIKNIFSGGRDAGPANSEPKTTSGIPGFKIRLGQQPKGPRQQPVIWKATKM